MHRLRPTPRALALPFLTLLLSAAPAAAQGAATFAAKVDEVAARPEFKHSEFGVALLDLETGQPVYRRSADKFFTPGSTTKLLTEGAALALLGKDYRFRTPIYRTGPVRGGTLNGDLVLVASGDPNLSGRIVADTLQFANEDHSYGGDSAQAVLPGDPLYVVRKLAAQVAEKGIRRVTGRVLVDASLFPQGDRELGTGVVISPIAVNDNVIDLLIRPGARPGDPVTVKVSPDIGYLKLVNKATTGAPGSQPSLRRERPTRNPDGSWTLELAGSYPAGKEAMLDSWAVPDPTRFAELALVTALKEKGVAASMPPVGEEPDFTKLAASYTDANKVAEHVSLPLSEEIKVTLKVSQNLHASMMPYLLGVLVAKNREQPEQAGFDAERDFLRKAGLDTDGASQGDGAGGAPGAFFTPDFMVRYLAYMATRPDFATFRRALPVLGVDGTLWNIEKGSPAAGHVFAKTGTFIVEDPLNQRMIVTGKGLAGYIERPDGRRLAFAAYANRVPYDRNRPNGPQFVGEALGEIAAAAYALPLAGAGTTR